MDFEEKDEKEVRKMGERTERNAGGGWVGSRGRGRGGGRGRGRGEEPVSPQDDLPASDGSFKCPESSDFLSDKYQKAVASTAQVYRSKERAWGASNTMLQETSPDAFAKLFATALEAHGSKSATSKTP